MILYWSGEYRLRVSNPGTEHLIRQSNRKETITAGVHNVISVCVQEETKLERLTECQHPKINQSIDLLCLTRVQFNSLPVVLKFQIEIGI